MGTNHSRYDLLSEGIIRYKKNGDITYCNKSALDLLKYDTKPSSIFDLIQQHNHQLHKKLLSKGTIKDMSNKNILAVCKDGSISSIDITMLPGRTLLLSDIRLKQIHDLVQYKTILSKTEELCITGYWEWEVLSGGLEWSDGLKEIFEIDEVNYETYISCIHEEDYELVTGTIQKCLEDNKDYSIIHRFVANKSKKIKWLRSIGKHITRPGGVFLVGVAQDITIQKNIERDLEEKSLKHEHSLRAKSDFVSSVSHELRTPLNGIIGMVSLLQSTGLSHKQTNYVEVLHSSCGVLLSIVNNILDFSKIESGKISLDLNVFNISTSIKKIFDLFKPISITKGISMSLTSNLEYNTVIADEIKISQILSNLLSNSLKFTSKGQVEIDVSCTVSTLNIIVKDTGIGIRKDFLNEITSPFTQEDSSTTRNYGGSGLGLSIVNSYIEIMNGSLKFESIQGEGTKVYISIPIRTNNILDVIVIVEDNYANQYIIKEMLSNITDIPVICYDNGIAILGEIKQEPLIIFMDIHMPGMDGHTTTKKLREKGYTCPIVALTANSIRNERIKCLESGMDDFLLKPVDIPDISLVLQKYNIKKTS